MGGRSYFESHKIKPLFETYQIRKLTFDEKIKYVLEMLIEELHPIITGKNSIVYYDYSASGNKTHSHREYYDIIFVNIENLQKKNRNSF
jgi:hypothetical protein